MAMYSGGDGSCAQDAPNKGCWDRHGVSIALTSDWKEYSFTWSQLRQAGWGTKAPWDAKLTAEIVFEASANDATVPTIDFSVDNVGFFKGMAPTDSPMPGK